MGFVFFRFHIVGRCFVCNLGLLLFGFALGFDLLVGRVEFHSILSFLSPHIHYTKSHFEVLTLISTCDIFVVGLSRIEISLTPADLRPFALRSR